MLILSNSTYLEVCNERYEVVDGEERTILLR